MINIIDLKKSFGAKKILDGVNLTIEKGQITVILGRSGVGKSVLIKHIVGLLRPDSGKILFEDMELTAMKEHDFNEVLKRFGMLFQGAALFDSMTVAENVGFPLREHTDLSDADILKAVQEKLHRVGLVGIEDMMPAELSGGMKKRVGLARAIVMDPEIVLFDEPTTGQDPIMSDSVADLILETQRALKTTYVIISHDIALALKVADKIAMLHEGRIIAEGTSDEMRRTDNPMLRQFLDGKATGPIKIY
ncbi:MAG: ABC transporter ATP-binding protein [Deltaproteobacteria bacterium RIFCSPLOWO2_02_FULL_53_8]|nr:MAG: ABC transporter ATP-binding protein [Deltaproteobacteria bacterium RIFCSPLOWO2_02_FULL_53_8]